MDFSKFFFFKDHISLLRIIFQGPSNQNTCIQYKCILGISMNFFQKPSDHWTFKGPQTNKHGILTIFSRTTWISFISLQNKRFGFLKNSFSKDLQTKKFWIIFKYFFEEFLDKKYVFFFFENIFSCVSDQENVHFWKMFFFSRMKKVIFLKNTFLTQKRRFLRNFLGTFRKM